MADDAGHPRPDLSFRSPAPENVQFFELLRRLERGGRRFGRSGGPGQEPARLGQRARLGFATRDVAGFQPGQEDEPARVEIEVLGLFGPEGAMPLHLTRWIMARQAERWFSSGAARASADTTFLDFCNMLQHRMLALYWRAWADQHPEVQVEHPGGGRLGAMISTLAGVGLPGLREANSASRDPDLALRLATSLAQEVNGPERLTLYLSDFLGAPVRLVEFIGDWLEIPAPLQSRLGQAHAGLGQGAVVGARVYQRQGRAELRVGPLSLARYVVLVTDRAERRALRRAIRLVAGTDIAFDLRPILARDEIPAPRLGQVRLGLDCWLGAPRGGGDADDHLLRGFSAREDEGVAA